MIICHLYESEEYARRGFDEFVYDNPDKIKLLFSNHRKEVVTIDGNDHFFMGRLKYFQWCKGRTYMLDGRLLHSGYALERKIQNELL